MKEFRKSKYNNFWNYKWVKEPMMILQNHSKFNLVVLLCGDGISVFCLMPNICVLNERMKDGNEQNNNNNKNFSTD